MKTHMYEESALVCEVLYDCIGLGETGLHPDHPGTHLHVVHLHLPGTKESEGKYITIDISITKNTRKYPKRHSLIIDIYYLQVVNNGLDIDRVLDITVFKPLGL